jgi:hypothetical protein
LGLVLGSSGLVSIETDLTLWLDAQKESTLFLDGNNRVELWTNRNNLSSHAVQSVPEKRPEYDETDQMIDFTGSQYFFVENQSVDVNTTYFVVYQGSEPNGTIFAKANANGNWTQGGKTFFIRSGRYMTDVGWVGVLETSSLVSTNNASIATFVHRENGNEDVHRIYYNGMKEVDAIWNFDTFSESSLQDGGIFKIGYTSDNFPQGHGLYGQIGEIIKVDQALDANFRYMIQAYLASKWGITEEVDSDDDGVMDSTDANAIDPNHN